MKAQGLGMMILAVLLILSFAGLAWSFDLTRHSVPGPALSTGGLPKDTIPALTNPEFVPAEKADSMTPDERVMGVVINDEPRAYPLRILNSHEIVNDDIQGQPIAVTW